ncbi:MAG TPA: universal stress protein [Acidobacteriota bacterium]|nr:universal stress protein [Acidobacteriota bacterium]
MIKRILVALAGSQYSEREVEEAVRLAQIHEASLTGVTVVDIDRLSDTGAVPLGAGFSAQQLAEYRIEEAREQSRQAVEGFHKACEKAGVSHRLFRENGDPFETLISHWRYHDLTLLGLRGLFEFGIIDEPHDSIAKLISRGVRPVLTVHQAFESPIKVLVGYNGSMESAKAMKRFVQLHLWPDCRIRVVCYDENKPREEARQLIEEAVDYCHAHGFEAEGEVMEGDPTKGLLEEANNFNADVVVAGNSHRRLILRKVFGSTTLRLIEQCERALFLTQ